ncbi:MAG TPA: GAF and ANTAR domain-containing protein [Glaciihabitans sp.]|nr:GAF and ANTAR domain-containing protein [Glaciihabitans sp.]
MNNSVRSEQLFEAFATFADTLVTGYDVLDLLQKLVERCRELLNVDSAGILLVNDDGTLELVASTSEESAFVEVIQLDANAGPSLDAFRSQKVVSVPNVAAAPEQWAAFTTAAAFQGINCVYVMPLRLREVTIGTLSLMRHEPGELRPYDIKAAKALADVATIGILQERRLRDAESVREQLQEALSSRIVIEQAKGVVAETAQVSMDTAFSLIRNHARTQQQSLRAVAGQLISGDLRL